MGVFFDLLGKLGSKRVIKGAANYLSTAVYVLYRHLHKASPNENDGFFSVSDTRFEAGLTNADLIFSESDYVEALASEKKKGEFPPMTHDEMTAAYPGTYQSLLQIVHATGERVGALAEGRKTDKR